MENTYSSLKYAPPYPFCCWFSPFSVQSLIFHDAVVPNILLLMESHVPNAEHVGFSPGFIEGIGTRL